MTPPQTGYAGFDKVHRGMEKHMEITTLLYTPAFLVKRPRASFTRGEAFVEELQPSQHPRRVAKFPPCFRCGLVTDCGCANNDMLRGWQLIQHIVYNNSSNHNNW